jgi:hypothetical protein
VMWTVHTVAPCSSTMARTTSAAIRRALAVSPA